MRLKENEIAVIEDFRKRSASVAKKDEEFLRFLDSEYMKNRKYLEELLDEVEFLQVLYDNKDAVDFFGQTREAESEEQSILARRRLFKSSFVSMTTNLRTSIMTDGKPKVYFNPCFKKDAKTNFIKRLQEGEFKDQPWVEQLFINSGGSVDVFFDMLIDSYLNYWWDRNDIGQTMHIIVKNSILASKAWSKLSLSGNNIEFNYIPFKDISEDPQAINAKDRKAIFHTVLISPRDVERMFDLPKNSIKSEFDDVDPNSPTNINKKEYTEYLTPTVRLVEAYFKDDSVVETELPETPMVDEITGEFIYDENGMQVMQPAETVSYPLYPGGRIVTFIYGQDNMFGIQILSDEANQYSEFPIVDYIPEPDTETRGMPIARALAAPQLIADRAVQQSLLNQEAVGNAKIFYRQNETTNMKNISNRIAAKIPVADIGDIIYQAPTNAINEGIALYNIMAGVVRDLSGLHETAEGKRLPNIQSGRAYISIDEIGNRRLRPSIRFFEVYLKKVFKIWGEMFLQIAQPGFISVLGTTFSEKIELPFAISDFVDKFDIQISEDSTLPKDPNTQANLYLTLAQTTLPDGQPLIDRQSLLEALKLEDADRITARLAQEKEEMLQIQQIMQQNQQMQQQIQQMQQIIAKSQDPALQVKMMQMETEKELTVMKEMNKREMAENELEAKRKQSAEAIILQGSVNENLARAQSKGEIIKGKSNNTIKEVIKSE